MHKTLALAFFLSAAAASRAQYVYAGNGLLDGISADSASYQFDPDVFSEGTGYADVATHTVYDSDAIGWGDGISSSGTAMRLNPDSSRYQFRYADGSTQTIEDALGRPAVFALIDSTHGNALATNAGGVFRVDSATRQASSVDMGGVNVSYFTVPSADGSFGFTTTASRAGAYAGGSAFLLDQGNYAYSYVDGGINPTGGLTYAFGHVIDGQNRPVIASWKIDPIARTSVLTTYSGLDATLFDLSNPIASGWAYGFSNGARAWFDLETGSVIPDTDSLPSADLFDFRKPVLTDGLLGLSLSDTQNNLSVFLNGNVPQAVPEPATLAVLGLGASAALRRKRP